MSGIDFSGRVLFVTGSGGAIGAAIARAYLDLVGACILTDLAPESLAALGL